MPTLDDDTAPRFIKLFLIGDSGTGKTGALLSLIKAGYKLRIIDLDNGLTALRQFGRRECPELLHNVDYETMRDTYVASPLGPKVKGQPKAFMRTMSLLSKWTDDTDPAEWGADHILVLDSMTMLGRAAFAWAQSLNPGAKDPRNWFFAGQRALEATIDTMCGEAFGTNVIIISHITDIEDDGLKKGYPTTLGKALSKTIAQYVDIVLMVETIGAGKNVKRTIRTLPTANIDLKNPAPFKVEATLPQETGLADFFRMMKEE